jgi:hypothetical protein
MGNELELSDMPPLTELEHAQLRVMERDLSRHLSNCCNSRTVNDPGAAFEYARTFAVKFFDFIYNYYSMVSDQTYESHWRPASEKFAYERVVRCLKNYTLFDTFLWNDGRDARLKKTISDNADLFEPLKKITPAKSSYPPVFVSADPVTASESKPVPAEDLITQRVALLEAYKGKTNTSNRKIYESSNSGIHKPEFYKWLGGRLPNSSATTMNFERFLRGNRPPAPRKPKS